MPLRMRNRLANKMQGKPSAAFRSLSEGEQQSDESGVLKEVLTSQELLEEYQRHRETWAQKFHEDEQFRAGVQWTKEQEENLTKRGQSAIVINRIHPIVETAKALLTFRKPEFRSTGREDSDTRTAKVVSDLFQWVWDISKGNEELKQCIDDYYVGGLGYLQVYQDAHADKGNGEVFLTNLYPLDVYVDPNARDLYFNDAANIIVARILTDEQAEKLFPDKMSIISNAAETIKDRYPSTNLKAQQGEQFLGDVSTTDSMYHKHREYIERYTKIKTSNYHVFEQNIGKDYSFHEEQYQDYRKEPAAIILKGEQENIITDEAGLQEAMMMVNTVGPIFHLEQEMTVNPQTGEPTPDQPKPVPGPEQGGENEIPGSTTQIQMVDKGSLIDAKKILMNKVMETRVRVVASVGDSLLYDRILPCMYYPIIPLVNIHLRNPYPLSDVRIYKPIQQYINKIRSLIIAHASTSTNVKLLIPRGAVDKSVIEQEWGRAGTAVIEFDAELGAPVVAGPVPLPNELYKNEADAKTDLEYGFGIHDIMMGSAANAPSTYRGTVAIDEYGQRRAKSRQEDVEQFLNQVGRVALPLMQEMYTEEKVVRLVQPDGTVRETQFNQRLRDQYTNQEIGKVHDMTTGQYDIVVVSGSTLPSNRWAQLETYLQMFKMGLIDQTEVLKKTEVVDTEGVMQRMDMVQKLQGALQQATEEIKKLKGDLQTSEREETHAKKRIEVEKFKANLESPKEKIKFASALYDARLKDELQKVKTSVSGLEEVNPEA